MRESAVEIVLNRRVQQLGGMSVKLAPTVKGMPDRLVMLPGGQLHLVELKTTNGRLSEAQKLFHLRLAHLGIHVHVLHGPMEVAGWIRERYREAELYRMMEARNRKWLKRMRTAMQNEERESSSAS